jgi:hypothetical protein
MSAWASLNVADFLRTPNETIVGTLAGRAASRGLAATPETYKSWEEAVQFLRESLLLVAESQDVTHWGLLLEYEIPRRAVRPDAVLLARGQIYVLEFKVGANRFDRSSIMQVGDYALDLRDFHKESLGRPIYPVLISTAFVGDPIRVAVDGVDEEVRCVAKAAQFAMELLESHAVDNVQIELGSWNESAYQPTPDILTASRAVYAGNEVREISFAYADNLTATVDSIRRHIAAARARSEHLAIFVTGVPGSGKTLAGLSAVHQIVDSGASATEPLGAYLSGNGPLIDVLQYALAKDLRKRESITDTEAKRRTKTFIQPVHAYIREYSSSDKIPPDHVVVFDEAQRAWDAKQMMDKQKIDASEAKIILSAMERVNPWSVLVALVGEGQEINRGEAGLDEWIHALVEHSSWKVIAADDLHSRFTSLSARLEIDNSMHLSVNVRSPRAQAIADWAHLLVNGQLDEAAEIIKQFPNYPLLMTRSLHELRQYLRDRVASSGLESDRRSGLLASSQARRLRPFGIEMSNSFQGGIDWPRWFVNEPTDIRSSFLLEVAASEFKCQGLEIDWSGVCWGDDFVWSSKDDQWRSRRLRGSSWVNDADMTFARNRYRVLLTRARFGQLIWVPKPTGAEALVDADGLEATASALIRAGVKPLKSLETITSH